MYEQASLGFIATLVNASVVAIILFQVVPDLLLAGWIVSVYLITAGRYLLVRQYRKHVSSGSGEFDYEQWCTYFLIGAALAGAAWGAAGSILLPSGSMGHQLVVMIALAGMASGAVPVLASVLHVYYVYLVLLLLPVIAWLLAQHSTPHLYIAIMVSMFLVMLVATARKINANLTESSRLHFMNEELLAETKTSTDELVQANLDLESEITIRKEIERELLASKEFMEKVMDSAFNAIYVIDSEGRFILVNEATEKITGYSMTEMIGMHFEEIVVSDQLSRAEYLFQRSVVEGQPVHGENMEIVSKAGIIREVVITHTPLREGDHIAGVVGIAEDITDQLQLQRLRTEFVSTVSHELRTPLTSIRGSLGLMRGGAAGDLPDPSGELVNIAYSNCNRLLKMVNDLLDIQKLESGKLHIRLQPASLPDILQSAVSACRDYASQYGVELLLEVPDTDVQVSVDVDRFAQVMANLVSNAIKFSGNGKAVSIRVLSDASHARIAVIDQGRGIQEAYRERIFDKFMRVDASNTRDKDGPGLGLTIARSLVENMHGSLSFESKPGAGSTFTVCLPVARHVLPEVSDLA